MVKIKIVKTGSGFPPVGSIHGARRLNRDGALLDLYPDFQIIGGGYSGIIIPFKCAFVLPEERTYTEAEYNEILQQRDKAIDDLAKYAQELAELKSERQMLLETIEKAAGERKLVELPLKVVDAIEYLKQFGTKNMLAMILRGQVTGWVLGNNPKRELAITILRSHEFGDILNALVNGYTVEKTAEKTTKEQLKEKVVALIDEWYNSSVTDAGYEAEIQQLADRIVEHAKQLT